MRSHERLAAHTTLNIGGPALALAMPATKEELLRGIACCREFSCPFLIIGNGSNIVFADEGYEGVVFKTLTMNTISFPGDGLVTAGAGALNQMLLKSCHAQGLGGIEYLYSVPGTVGGAAFMNAGRGWWHFQSIGTKIVSAEIWDGDGVRTLGRRECGFGYRTSAFQEHPEWVILSVTLRLSSMSPSRAKARLAKRMKHVEAAQDRSHPNAGSVFRAGFKRKVLSEPSKRFGDMMLSPKTNNWMINLGNGTARDAKALVAWIQDEHSRGGKPEPKLEIRFLP